MDMPIHLSLDHELGYKDANLDAVGILLDSYPESILSLGSGTPLDLPEGSLSSMDAMKTWYKSWKVTWIMHSQHRIRLL